MSAGRSRRHEPHPYVQILLIHAYVLWILVSRTVRSIDARGSAKAISPGLLE